MKVKLAFLNRYGNPTEVYGTASRVEIEIPDQELLGFAEKLAKHIVSLAIESSSEED